MCQINISLFFIFLNLAPEFSYFFSFLLDWIVIVYWGAQLNKNCLLKLYFSLFLVSIIRADRRGKRERQNNLIWVLSKQKKHPINSAPLEGLNNEMEGYPIIIEDEFKFHAYSTGSADTVAELRDSSGSRIAYDDDSGVAFNFDLLLSAENIFGCCRSGV